VLFHLRHSYRPTNLLLVPDGKELRFTPVADGGQLRPGVVFYHFGADLYFANAATFGEDVFSIIADAKAPVETVVLDFSAVGDIDFSAAFMLNKLITSLKEKKIALMVTDVIEPVAKEMERSGLTELIGSENIHQGVTKVVEALERQDGRPALP
jgi:SulP family sulfate permease